MGLKESEHIGRIVIDPRNSDVVYVAAQGPLWRKGGDRGVYKTTDGGKTWTKILGVDDWTGANDIQLDPRNPDVLVATTWQRNRRMFAFIAGGPGLGRVSLDRRRQDVDEIAIRISERRPRPHRALDVARESERRLRDRRRGERQGRILPLARRRRELGAHGRISDGRQLLQRIFADPKNVDRVYAVDVNLQVTDDGGKHFSPRRRESEARRQPLVVIDPDATDHLIVGCDGGVYETFDRGAPGASRRTCRSRSTTASRRTNRSPFYRVFGGAQDNFSVGGPSRTRTNNGIRNADWFITSGGDGFGSVVDPVDPNTVYAESQFGVLVAGSTCAPASSSAFNPSTSTRRGAAVELGLAAVRQPALAHANLLRGESPLPERRPRRQWRAVSPDITRQIDRTSISAEGPSVRTGGPETPPPPRPSSAAAAATAPLPDVPGSAPAAPPAS